ncbi:hypothetical protein [Dokdonella sp.]|uniref:hypothetical protein n=1 Tax=Dokdonella sp. TaxID=2291710 RepID=UPI002F429172
MGLIVLARAVHVIAGVTWAGAMFVLAAAILPAAREAGGGAWFGALMRRVGPLSGLSSLLTVLSGAYLFFALHAHDATLAGWVLRVGALAALLAMVVGFTVGRPAGLELARLQQAGEVTPEQRAHIGALGRRVALSVRTTASLMALSVLAMGVFRYVVALA